MKKLFTIIFCLSLSSLSFGAKTSESQETYKDIKKTLGIVPTFMQDYPASGIAGAWEEMKGIELNAESAIPGKYKELIGLAVASQIPCNFCTYFHTQMAVKLNKATKAELQEAIAMSAGTRRWSAFLYGSQIDKGQFRSEVDKMLLSKNKKTNLQAMEVKPQDEPIILKNADDVYKEVKESFGFVPVFIKEYPRNSVVGAWKDMKEFQMGETEVPGKYKQLIGLAVASQVPCEYCVYFHTQSALMAGATKEEISEAVALAGTVRNWSTILNGNMNNEKDFRQEVKRIINHVSRNMPKEVSLTAPAL
jgi:AhpD family alkylhydroperoxidase